MKIIESEITIKNDSLNIFNFVYCFTGYYWMSNNKSNITNLDLTLFLLGIVFIFYNALITVVVYSKHKKLISNWTFPLICVIILSEIKNTSFKALFSLGFLLFIIIIAIIRYYSLKYLNTEKK